MEEAAAVVDGAAAVNGAAVDVAAVDGAAIEDFAVSFFALHAATGGVVDVYVAASRGQVSGVTDILPTSAVVGHVTAGADAVFPLFAATNPDDAVDKSTVLVVSFHDVVVGGVVKKAASFAASIRLAGKTTTTTTRHYGLE